MKLKLKQEAKWLTPYLEAVADLVDLTKLKEIRFSTYRDSFPSFHGLIETTNGKTYKITIRTYEGPDKRLPMTKLDQETVLSHLAHELAHLENWNDYEVRRFIIETKIYLRFGKVLKKLGYEKDRNKVKGTK